MVMNLMRFAVWRAIRAKFHALWGKAVGTSGYTRREWEELDSELEDLAHKGVGEPDKDTSDEDEPTKPGVRRR